MGEHWVTAPMQLIVPRFVWRDKPVVGRLSSIFRERYWKQVRDSNTSIAVTLFGDFWINFHMLGVLLGGFFIGVFLRYLYNFLQIGAGANSVVCHAVYATMLVPSLLYSEKLVDQLLTGMPKIALILWLGTLFLAPRARFSPPPAHSRVQGSSVA